MLCIGHRGAPREAPENTIASFRAAVTAGVDLVELDVDALADGTLVVAHSLDPAELGGPAPSGEVPPASVASLRVIAPGVLTLDEALAFFAEEAPFGRRPPRSQGRLPRHPDGRARGRPRARGSHGGELDRGGGAPRRRLGGERDRARAHVPARPARRLPAAVARPSRRRRATRRHAPAAPLRIPTRASPGRRRTRRSSITGSSRRPLVARLRARGIVTLAWTVDDPGEVRRVVEAGVEGVISNDPSMVLATLSS